MEWVLQDLGGKARLTEFVQVSRDDFEIALEIPGEVSKRLVVPQAVMQRALHEDPPRTLPNIIRAAVCMAQSAAAASESREMLAVSGHLPVCPRCLRLRVPDEAHAGCGPVAS